ncbi:MAG: ABC transporter substrate-binding protein [Candidatus Tectimicrobiota bacterium]
MKHKQWWRAGLAWCAVSVLAKRLLAQAGYPKGFKAKIRVYQFAGAPELVPLLEAIQMQLREVGIELETEEADVTATVTPKLRDRRANWYRRPSIPSQKAVEPQLAGFNTGKGVPHQFETDELYAMWEQLLQTPDPKVVADWSFPGWDGGDLGHTWLIKACKQEKPCK